MKRIILMAGVLVLAAAGSRVRSHQWIEDQSQKDAGRASSWSTPRAARIYTFTRDKRNTDVCMKIKFCTSTWPPVTTKGKPVAGPGIQKSKLGTIKLPKGKLQVTYFGPPALHVLGRYRSRPDRLRGRPDVRRQVVR